MCALSLGITGSPLIHHHAFNARYKGTTCTSCVLLWCNVLTCCSLTLTTAGNMNKTDNLPSLGSLSTSLLSSFLSLGAGARRVFIRLYSAVWAHLVPISRVDAGVYLFGLVVLLSRLSPSISVHCWLVLSRFWLLSLSGSRSVDVRALGLSSSEIKQVSKLVSSGILRRSFFCPLHPHLAAYRSQQPVFVTFTPAGITFFKLVLRSLRDRSREEVFQYMNYEHKKGQTV